MTTDTPDTPAGAEAFLMSEYQSLQMLHQIAKDEGDKRLTFYITFIAAIGTVLAATGYFNGATPATTVWLLVGGATFAILIGLITFRKMLQRRVAIVIYRRRLARIRAWFVAHYPEIAAGLPYDTMQDLPMDWGRYRFGSTALSIVLINSFVAGVVALFVVVALAPGLVALGLLVALLVGALSWGLHLRWKWRWIAAAEARDVHDRQRLDEIAKRPSPPTETAVSLHTQVPDNTEIGHG